LNNGKSVLLELEISGARQVRAKNPEALLVFLAPPSWEELEERLFKRGTDTEERRAARLALARAEMAAQGEFDLTLINTSVEEVAKRLISLALT
jgi:guanylate kinase